MNASFYICDIIFKRLNPHLFSLVVYCSTSFSMWQAELTSGLPVQSVDEATASAKCLLEKGCKNHVLITMGEQGAVLLSRGATNKPVHIKAPSVPAIDTTVHSYHIFIQSYHLIK